MFYWSGRQGSQPTHETPLGMGATLDIQRQQRMDMLDQQLLLAQYNEARRNTRQQPQVDEDTLIATLMHWLTHTRFNLPITCCSPSANKYMHIHACIYTTIYGKLLDSACVCLCVSLCRVGCYSGLGYSPPWDTEDRTALQCSPAHRLRHSPPHSRHYWTTLLSLRSRCVSVCVYMCAFFKFSCPVLFSL